MKTGLLIFAGVDAFIELGIALLFYMTTGKELIEKHFVELTNISR